MQEKSINQGPCEPEKLYSQKELAPILGKSEAWFERARWSGSGPAFIELDAAAEARKKDEVAV